MLNLVIILAVMLTGAIADAQDYTLGDCQKTISVVEAIKAAASGQKVFKCAEFELKASKSSIGLKKVPKARGE